MRANASAPRFVIDAIDWSNGLVIGAAGYNAARRVLADFDALRTS